MERRFLAFAASLALSAGALAQQEPGMAPADPGQEQEEAAKGDPVGAMHQADVAFTALKTLSFKVHASGIGGLTTRTPVVDAAVKMARSEDAKSDFGWTFILRGTAHKSDQTEIEPLATWFDGKTVRLMREKDKSVLGAGWDYNDEPMNAGAGWALAWATRWKQLVTAPFTEADTHPRCRYEGDAIVEGVPCRVIYADYSELSDPRLMDAWWYLAKSDSLPRRVEM